MKNKFVKQLGLLGVIGIVIKIIGAIYRVPLGNYAPPEANTLYTLAYPWYTTLIVISTAALPAVIAKLVAEAGAQEKYVEQQRIFDVSKKIMTLFGLTTMVLLVVISQFVSRLSGYPDSIYSFYVLAIASFFVALNAAYRGFFQGVQRLEVFGFSQLFEQLARVVFGYSFVVAAFFLSGKDGLIAAGATSGAAFGALASWIYSVTQYRKTNRSEKVKLSEHKQLIKRIIYTMIPIAMGASIMPLLSIIDSTLVIWRLRQLNFPDPGLMFSYIQFYSAPIINLTQVIFTALQVSLLPMVTRAFTKKDETLNEKVFFGVLLSIALGLPMGLGISAFAEQILYFLYPLKASSVVIDAAPVLSILGLGVVFLSIYQASTAILQGLNQHKRPVRHLFIGAIVKVILAYILLGIPALNIKGAAISTTAAYAIAGLLNFSFILKHVKCPAIILKKMAGVVGANVAMILAARGCYALLVGLVGIRISLLTSILVAVVIYALLVLKTKLINLNDLKAMED